MVPPIPLSTCPLTSVGAQINPVCAGPSMERYVLQTSVNLPRHKALVGSVLQALRIWSLSGAVFSAALLGRVDPGGLKTGGFQFSLGGAAAIAQQVDPQARETFLSDPLTAKPRDPLLPVVTTDRPLRPLELRSLREGLAQLNQQAQAQLAAGQLDEAFASLLREIRLRRVFGPVAEFNAIAPVAELAWEQQRSEEVQLLTLRMREIWAAVQVDLADKEEINSDDKSAKDAEVSSLLEASAEPDIVVLSAIAQTFIDLRDTDYAVAVYRQIIDLLVAEGSDPTAVQRGLAAYHLSWFQFADAADVYLTLLQAAREQGNQTLEVEYLEQLVYSYQQASSLENAARAQTDLVGLYQAMGQEDKLPVLLLAIAQNYRALNWTNDAIAYYRSAYSAGQRFEQFSVSAQVLRDLGGVYRAIALTDEALLAYNLLVPVEEQAYNDYGIMNAYDDIGQLERRQGNLSEALQAFEKALVISNRLGLDEARFVEQIESVTQLEQTGPIP
ncbi:MAG: tetratricopeptide repeat protein [Phormidesmis sp.]